MRLTELRGQERASACATFCDVGPGAPTLCSQWSVADVAGHLVVSECYGGLPMVAAYRLRRVLPGGVREALMQRLRAVGEREIEKAKAKGWNWLLHRLEAGPPMAYRLSSVAPIRLVEEWIHHEDVRRANGMPPRPSSPELDEALWNAALVLSRFPEFLAERQGLEVVLPDGRSQRLGNTTRVRVEGTPGELLLFLAGRTAAAQVTTTGEADVIRALDTSLVV
jgi:uncharacterized protein (TIGR03085 family)